MVLAFLATPRRCAVVMARTAEWEIPSEKIQRTRRSSCWSTMEYWDDLFACVAHNYNMKKHRRREIGGGPVNFF